MLLEKSIHDITNFDYPSNSWRCMCKKPWGNNIICRLCQSLWLHTQREDGANTMCFHQGGNIFTLSCSSLILIDNCTYLGSSVSSTKKDINTWLEKVWTAINRPSVIGKSDLTDKMKRSFFQAVVISILPYGCTTWTLTKHLKKNLDSYYTKILRAILNKSWREHSRKQQLYSHLPPIMKTIQVRQIKHVEHCWRSRDELMNDILLWTSSHGQMKAGLSARTFIQKLCADMGCILEDLPGAMDDGEGWWERVRDIHAGSGTWWCIYLCVGIYIYTHTHTHTHTYIYIWVLFGPVK